MYVKNPCFRRRIVLYSKILFFDWLHIMVICKMSEDFNKIVFELIFITTVWKISKDDVVDLSLCNLIELSDVASF